MHRLDLEKFQQESIILKILYKTKTFKEGEYYSKTFDKKFKTMKCRIIHPLGFIVFIIWMLGGTIVQGLPETINDFKNEFTL